GGADQASANQQGDAVFGQAAGDVGHGAAAAGGQLAEAVTQEGGGHGGAGAERGGGDLTAAAARDGPGGGGPASRGGAGAQGCGGDAGADPGQLVDRQLAQQGHDRRLGHDGAGQHARDQIVVTLGRARQPARHQRRAQRGAQSRQGREPGGLQPALLRTVVVL